MLFCFLNRNKTISDIFQDLFHCSLERISITSTPCGDLKLPPYNQWVGCGVVMLSQDGSFLGRQLSMGWNGGLLYYPTQMCMNEKREVFIADRGNSRIQIFMVVK
jgi:hypothetical protein